MINFYLVIVSVIYIAWWGARGNWHDFSVILVLMLCGMAAVLELAFWWGDD